MRRFYRLIFAAAAMAASAVASPIGLARCVDAAPLRTAAAHRGHEVPKELFVSNYTSVAVLNGQYQPIDEITTGLSSPQGAWVDASGNLYVADANEGYAAEYRRGKTTPDFIYPGAITPTDVATDGSGNVYVVDGAIDTPLSNVAGGDVLEYAQGSQRILKRFGVPGLPQTEAFDSKGNLFVDFLFRDPDYIFTVEVEEFDGADPAKGHVLGFSGHYAYGMKIDKADNLILCDSLDGYLFLIQPPYNGYYVQYFDYAPTYLAFNKTGDLLYAAQFERNAGNVVVYAYPSFQVVATLGASNGVSYPNGVAVYPGIR